MALTRQFKETVGLRAKTSVRFRRALLEEALNNFMLGDSLTAKSLLKDYINAIHSINEIAFLIHVHPKSLHRMLSVNGNPNMESLSSLIKTLVELDGGSIVVKLKAA